MITIEDIEAMLDEDAVDREAHAELAKRSGVSLEEYLAELRETLRVIKAYQEAFDKGKYQ